MTLAQGSMLLSSLLRTASAQSERNQYCWHALATKKLAAQADADTPRKTTVRATYVTRLLIGGRVRKEAQSLAGNRKRQTACRQNDWQTGKSGRSHSRFSNCPANLWRIQVVGRMDLVSVCLGVVIRTARARCRQFYSNGLR